MHKRHLGLEETDRQLKKPDRERLTRARLISELGFDENAADRALSGDAGIVLLELKDCGVRLSEDDPFLYIVLESSDTTCLHYYNNGNYGLPANDPGTLLWPGGGPPAPGAPVLPGVDAVPDRALGRFLAAQPGIMDLSGGNMVVFRGSASDIEQAREAVLASTQFRRLSASTANRLAVPAHPPLALFYQLNSMNGPPILLRTFNIA